MVVPYNHWCYRNRETDDAISVTDSCAIWCDALYSGDLLRVVAAGYSGGNLSVVTGPLFVRKVKWEKLIQELYSGKGVNRHQPLLLWCHIVEEQCVLVKTDL